MRASRAIQALMGAVFAALLAGCGNNEYGPPPEGGQPQNWGQQHYLNNQRYVQMNIDRMNR